MATIYDPTPAPESIEVELSGQALDLVDPGAYTTAELRDAVEEHVTAALAKAYPGATLSVGWQFASTDTGRDDVTVEPFSDALAEELGDVVAAAFSDGVQYGPSSKAPPVIGRPGR